MDSELSLIEIAGEDDSLLQQIPGDGISSLNTNRSYGAGDYFMCSPLQLPKSSAKPIGAIASNEVLEDTKHSFYRDGVNKGNFNVDKAETPKLSIEPQQMKRKKKGGGYNLRKSLAWDRAFFTEEGVLDPVELSMISGNFSKSRGETLSAIQEEDTNCASNSLDLHALEGNLFNKLPATMPKKCSSSGSLLLKKRDNEAPNLVATRKVLSAHDVNRSGSKRNAFPRPVASSSLKRPANLVTTTTSAKDSKVSRVPVQKTNPCASSRIAKSTSTLGASDSKQNMITQPAVNVQKISGLKGSPNDTKNVVNSSKSGPAGKSLTTKMSLRQAKRTVPTSVKSLQTNVQFPLNTEANSEVIPNPPLPSTRFASNVEDDIARKIGQPLSQTACTSAGVQRTQLQTAKPSGLPMPSPSLGFALPLTQTTCTSAGVQRTQLQTAKPSGLRMPSPSLGFFGQSKVPALQNPLPLPNSLKRNFQPSNLPKADTSNFRKLRAPSPVFEPRTPLASGSLPEVFRDRATTRNIKASRSTSGCSGPSVINPASHEIVEPDSQLSNMQKMENKGQCNSEAIKGQKEFHSNSISVDHKILVQAGRCTSKSTSQVEDVMQQRNNDNFLQAGTLQRVDDTDMKVANGSAISTKGSEIEENLGLTFHSSSASEVTTLSVKSDIDDHLLAEDKPSYLSIEDHGVSSEINIGECNVNEPSGKQAEMMNALSFEVGPISSRGMLEDNVANISSGVQNYNVSESEKSEVCSALGSVEQENADANALDKVRAQSTLEDADVKSLDANTTVKSSTSHISTSVNNQHKVVVTNAMEKTEYLEFPKCPLTREQALRDQVMLHVNDCLLGGKSFFPEESKLENDIQSDESEVTDGCESEFKRSNSPCLIPVAKQDHGSDTAKLVECQNHEDIPPVSIGSKRAVENCNLDAQFQNDVELHDHSVSMELGNMDEDHLMDAVSAEDVNVTCQKSGLFGDSEHEVPYTTCEPSLIAQVEGDCWTNHVVEHDDANVKEVNLSIESSYINTNLKPEDEFSSDCDDSSMGQIYVLSENDVSKCQEDQDKQIISCLSEADRISHEEKQNLEAHCLSFEHGQSPEQLQKSQSGNNTGGNLEVSVHDGSVLKSPALPLHEHMGQALKEAGAVNCMSGEPDANSELQDPVNQIKEVFPASVPGAGLNYVSLADNSAELFSNETDFENVLKEYNEAPVVQIDGLDVNKNSESLEVEVAVTSSLEVVPSVEDVQSVMKCRPENEVSNEAPKSYLDPKESNNQKSVNCTLDIEQQYGLENILPAEDKDLTRKQGKSGIEKKQDILVKPPPYVTPFSDEWLAAFEAAGEEILTMKSGAVQNSPQDRSQPEPGPWSPVKRMHNQVIGPFDCTKYTNTNQ